MWPTSNVSLVKYTPCLKKPNHCYFLNSFVKHWTVLIIFGVQHQKETWRNWLYSFAHLTLLLLHYLRNAEVVAWPFTTINSYCTRLFWDTVYYYRGLLKTKASLYYAENYAKTVICMEWRPSAQQANVQASCQGQGRISQVTLPPPPSINTLSQAP